MKTILLLSILFCAITMPTLGELTAADLDKIRLIVNDSEKRVKAEIAIIHRKIEGLDTRLRTVETGVAELQGRSIGFGVLRDWIVPTCAVGAFIISIFALVKAQPKQT